MLHTVVSTFKQWSSSVRIFWIFSLHSWCQSIRFRHICMKRVHNGICAKDPLLRVPYNCSLLRGHRHPRAILWMFVHFSKNNATHWWQVKYVPLRNILRNVTTALEFHWLKWLLAYGSEHGKYWFSHIVYSNFTTMFLSAEIKLWCLSSLEYF